MQEPPAFENTMNRSESSQSSPPNEATGIRDRPLSTAARIRGAGWVAALVACLFNIAISFSHPTDEAQNPFLAAIGPKAWIFMFSFNAFLCLIAIVVEFGGMRNEKKGVSIMDAAMGYFLALACVGVLLVRTVYA